MPSRWIAVDAGVDPVSWARLLRRANRRTHEGAARSAEAPAPIIRPVVAESWARAKRAEVPTDERPPRMLERREAERALKRHRLAMLVPVVQTVLVEFAEYAHQVVSIADAEGLILWTRGDRDVLAAAEDIQLIPGALWSEDAAGTNSLGTALVLDHPVQIFSAEHYKPLLHMWSAAAAPIHAPETGAILGAVSVWGTLKAAHPHGLSLVASAAYGLDAHLSHEAAQLDEQLKVEYLEQVRNQEPGASAVVNSEGRVLLSTPNGWLGPRMRLAPDGAPLAPPHEDVTIEPTRCGEGFVVRPCSQGNDRPRVTLRLEALGRNRVEGSLAGRRFRFTPRHGEILVILAHHAEGLEEEALAAAVYRSATKKVTIRAEISRLRKLLGAIVKIRPYRLAADVDADFLEVEDLLARGDHAAAAARCRGPLLPSSTAPDVVTARERIDEALTTPVG